MQCILRPPAHNLPPIISLHTPPHNLPHCLPTSSSKARQHYIMRHHPNIVNHRLHASEPCSPAKSCLPCVRSYRHTDFLYCLSLIGPGTSAACSASGLAVVCTYTACRWICDARRWGSVDVVVRGRYSSIDAIRLEESAGRRSYTRVVTRTAWASRKLYQPCW